MNVLNVMYSFKFETRKHGEMSIYRWHRRLLERGVGV